MEGEQLENYAMALEKLHEQMVDIHLMDARASSMEVANYHLRQLLLPILHGWGVGMQKGGALVYPRVGDNSQVVGEKVMRHPLYSCYPLKVLHPQLYSLMRSVNKVDGKHVVDYMEGIPLPLEPIERVWVTLAPDFPACGLGAADFPLVVQPADGREYLGPISKSLYESLVAWGGDIEDVVAVSLPSYGAGPNGTWIENDDWGYISGENNDD
jgi:hypothetical protein